MITAALATLVAGLSLLAMSALLVVHQCLYRFADLTDIREINTNSNVIVNNIFHVISFCRDYRQAASHCFDRSVTGSLHLSRQHEYISRVKPLWHSVVLDLALKHDPIR